MNHVDFNLFEAAHTENFCSAVLQRIETPFGVPIRPLGAHFSW